MNILKNGLARSSATQSPAAKLARKSDRRSTTRALPAFEPLEGRQMMSVAPLHVPVTAPTTLIALPRLPGPIHAPLGTDPIQAKYQNEGGAAGFLGSSLGPEMNTPQPGGTYEQFQYGNIYYSAATGAHVVSGAILAEYNALAGETDSNGHNVQNDVGLPTSDQIIPGIATARENAFQGGEIYWSAATGAHVVYGAINGHYNSIGGADSYLGLPTSDEQGIPGGREQYFQNGKILFSKSRGARDVPTQTSLTFTTGTIELGPVGGNAQLILYANGSYDFSGHFHDSGILSRNDSLVFGVRSPSGVLYTFSHSGHMAGEIESGSSDDNWDVSGSNPKLAAGWADLQGATYTWQASESTDLNSLINQIEQGAGLVLSIVSIVA